MTNTTVPIVQCRKCKRRWFQVKTDGVDIWCHMCNAYYGKAADFPALAPAIEAYKRATVIEKAFMESFGCEEPNTRVEDGRVVIYPADSIDLTFDKLAVFSEKIGTKAINIRYFAGDPGYSEYTPGSNSEMFIEVKP